MTAPELSRPVRVDTLGSEPRTIRVEADATERTALARRFGLLALKRLEATVELSGDGVRVDVAGRLLASVEQACVASGDPVPATIDEPFALRFVPEGDADAGEEVELAEEDLDMIGYDGGMIDLGEAVAQTLGLTLDPFPRAPDADAALRTAGVLSEEEVGPFAALKGLRDRLGG